MSDFTQYADDLRAVAEGLDEDAEDAVDAGRTRRAADRTRQGTRVDTGTTPRRAPHRPQGVRGGGGVHRDYAIFQEFGTSNMPPNPFIGPAFAQGAVDLVREVEEIADDVAEAL